MWVKDKHSSVTLLEWSGVEAALNHAERGTLGS